MLTGVIGLFIVVACAATLHRAARTSTTRATPPSRCEPLAGGAAPTLFGLGLVGAALLAAAIVPLSTAYSVAEAFEQPADLNDSFRRGAALLRRLRRQHAVAAAIVLIPGAPLIQILFLSQALNAVLLLAILPFLRALRRDRELMGEHRLGRSDSLLTAAVIALVAVSVAALGVLTLLG